MPVQKYDELLLKSLQDPNEAAEYLIACYEDSTSVFLQGLRMFMKGQVSRDEQEKR